MFDKKRRETDAAMLDSLASSFDMLSDSGGEDFYMSFHPKDVADMLRRAKTFVEPTNLSVVEN